MEVASKTVEDVLKELSSGKWRVPEFQREFVWTIAMVKDLLRSMVHGRPVGMITLWEQKANMSDSDLITDLLSLPDHAGQPGEEDGRIKFGKIKEKSDPHYAILDGLQRSTSMAMAIGGFRQGHGSRTHSGRYYVSLNKDDADYPIVHKSKKQVKKEELDLLPNCLRRCLVPLSPITDVIFDTWAFNVSDQIGDISNYGDDVPSIDELEDRRQRWIQFAKNIRNSKFAIYAIPQEYELGEICEIFETLNTTGTKVSTVDLIHSWLYRDTSQPLYKDPFKLRDWLDDFGDRPGVHGWSSSDRRPELTIQMITACYLADDEETRPKARRIQQTNKKISSVKAGDLLRTPPEFWMDLVTNHESDLADFIEDVQRLLAGGPFPINMLPYPHSAHIYIGLRWRLANAQIQCSWNREQLDAAFKAFFWRNVLATRYDQGVLTLMPSDLKKFEQMLTDRANLQGENWEEMIEKDIKEKIFDDSIVVLSKDLIAKNIAITQPSGALRDAYQLLFYAGSQKDLLSGKDIAYSKDNQIEMHHIFPKSWIDNNSTGKLKRALDDAEEAGNDLINSAANKMKLSADSNNEWKAGSPEMVLSNKSIKWNSHKDVLMQSFIDEECFKLLADPYPENKSNVKKFWEKRANLIADELVGLMDVKLER